MIDKIRCGDYWKHVRPDIPRVRHAQFRSGLDHPNCKLSNEQALEILNAPRTRGSVQALAAKYGVSKGLISAIRYGNARRHLIEQVKN